MKNGLVTLVTMECPPVYNGLVIDFATKIDMGSHERFYNTFDSETGFIRTTNLYLSGTTVC